MCAGAILNARIPRVVYGAADAHEGACHSIVRLLELPFHQKPEVVSGVLEEESKQLLKRFFTELRREVREPWKKKENVTLKQEKS